MRFADASNAFQPPTQRFPTGVPTTVPTPSNPYANGLLPTPHTPMRWKVARLSIPRFPTRFAEGSLCRKPHSQQR